VRDPRTVASIVQELVSGLATENVRVEKALLSPVRGRKGNRELLFLLRTGEERRGDVSPRGLEKVILGGWG